MDGVEYAFVNLDKGLSEVKFRETASEDKNAEIQIHCMETSSCR